MRNVFFSLGIAGIVFGVLYIAGLPQENQEARAGTGDAFSGWAWSENIGWVSFNCTNPGTCATIDYGVNIDRNGYLSGYAWSENIGWISFNLAQANTPPGEYNYSASGFIARHDTASNELRGWARALAPCAGGATTNCDSTGESEGGWDGWIKLQKHSSDSGANYGVTYNTGTKQLEGWAWGGDVAGWMSFNCLNGGDCLTVPYAVSADIDVPPSIPTLEAVAHSSATYCGSPQQKFIWSFSDVEDGTIQTAYWIQVDNNSDFLSLTFDSGKVGSPGSPVNVQERAVPVSVSPGPNQLAFNTTYFWRVQVYDSKDLSSSWVNGTSFATPLHPYPQPNFSQTPSGPSVGETVIFTDTTVFFNDGAGGLPDSTSPTWLWTISSIPPPAGETYVDGTNNTTQNPHVKFSNSSPKSVTLLAGDDIGSCSATKAMNLRPPLPQIIEF